MPDVPDPTFEASLAELERILHCLDDGSTTLEESLKQYERAVNLLKGCYQQLRSAEQRILAISGVDAEGRPTLQTFDHTAAIDSSAAVPKSSRPPRPAPTTRPAPTADPF